MACDALYPTPTCILAGHLFGIANDLISDFVEVVELLSGKVQELSPLVRVVLVKLDL